MVGSLIKKAKEAVKHEAKKEVADEIHKATDKHDKDGKETHATDSAGVKKPEVKIVIDSASVKHDEKADLKTKTNDIKEDVKKTVEDLGDKAKEKVHDIKNKIGGLFKKHPQGQETKEATPGHGANPEKIQEKTQVKDSIPH